MIYVICHYFLHFCFLYIQIVYSSDANYSFYDFSSYFTCKVQIFFLTLHLKPLQRIENEVKS